ncbi:MAG: hypothetical protein H0T47_15240 [Planctomycetaceae bacterium]|nr:hypothetical protein [Planctomycetaceae bacterium]
MIEEPDWDVYMSEGNDTWIDIPVGAHRPEQFIVIAQDEQNEYVLCLSPLTEQD